MADQFYILQNDKEDTLGATLAVGATNGTLSVGEFGSPATKQILAIDPDNSKFELIRATINGTALTNVERGLGGTTDVEHSSLAVVRAVYSSLHYANQKEINTNDGNLVVNSNFINNSTNGYGSTPDDWTNSSANPVQGGIPALTKQNLIDAGIAADGEIEGLWNLNNAYTDQSANGYTLTASGSPVFSDDGLMAKALDLEAGSTQYATGAAANAKLTGAQSFVAFFKPESIALQNICGFADSDNTDKKRLYLNASGQVVFELEGLTTASSITSDVILQAGKWYKIIGVYNSSAISIVINGVTKSTAASGSASAGTSTNFSIGRAGDLTTNTADGLVQNVIVFSKALSATEIKRLWALTNYSGQKIRRASSDGYIYQSLSQDKVMRLRGKTLTVSGKMYQEVASTGQISIYDGAETASTTSATTDSWLDATATKTISSTATEITIRLKASTFNGSVWFKEIQLSEGATTSPWQPAQEDWARFPRLMRQNPPAVVSGYEFEEGRVFSYTPTLTGFSASIENIGQFSVNGNFCTLLININGTSSAAGTTATAGVTAKNGSVTYFKAAAHPCVDNGTDYMTGYAYLTKGTITLTMARAAGTNYAASGQKAMWYQLTYDID